MDPNVLLWGFGAALALLMLFVWLRLVRFALSGRWSPGLRHAASDRRAADVEDEIVHDRP
jgi:hypothetical protein